MIGQSYTNSTIESLKHHYPNLRNIAQLDKFAAALYAAARVEALEEAAKRVERTAAALRSHKEDNDGPPTSEELAYCCDLNAKYIRALAAGKEK